MGLTGEKAVATPGASGTDEDDLTDDTPLEGIGITTFGGIAVCCNCFGPDRPDAFFAIRRIAKVRIKVAAACGEEACAAD